MLRDLSAPARDATRLIGGVTLAVAAVVLFVRKADEWDAFPLLLVLALPCALLYLLGTRWSPGLLVPAVLLTPLALLQFVDTIGGDASSSGNTAWVFALTAGLAAWCAVRARLPYGLLLAGLAWVVAWLSFWDQVADPSANGFRWLLVLVALLLAWIAFRVRPLAAGHATDLTTAAGLAAIGAGFLGVVGTGVGALAATFAGTDVNTDLAQHVEWDIFLLAVSLALVVLGGRWAVRGPVYVGAFGLLAFIGSVGAQVASLAEGDTPDHKFVGWPLVLLLAAAAALWIGFTGGSDEEPPADGLPPTPDAPVGAPGWTGE